MLDEITANLDVETEKEVLQALRRVSENRTVISISHRTSAERGRRTDRRNVAWMGRGECGFEKIT